MMKNKKTIITTLLSIVILIFVIFMCIPKLSCAIVMSGSMEDGISVNDVVVAVKQPTYNVGDIVSYNYENMLVTHRIVEETQNGYITKGDANNTKDDEIMKNSIVGKVVLVIPKVGSLIYFCKTPVGMLLLFLILLLIYKYPTNTKRKGDASE